MRSIWYSRRTWVATLGLLLLFLLGLKGEPVGYHVVAIVLGVVGANAAEGVLTSKSDAPK